MLTVHHLNNSRSQRVLWLLEELGVPYEIIRYQRQPDMRAPAELAQFIRSENRLSSPTMAIPSRNRVRSPNTSSTPMAMGA